MARLRTRLLVFTAVLAVAFGGTMVLSDDTGLRKEVEEYDMDKNGKSDGRRITHYFRKHRLVHCLERFDEASGKVIYRGQFVYHQGKLVLSETEFEWGSSFNTEPNAPGSVSVTFKDEKPAEVIVYDANRNFAWMHSRDEDGRLEPWSKEKVDELKTQSESFSKGLDALLENPPDLNEPQEN